MRVEGVYVATATPFRKDGQLCLESLDRLLNKLVEQKVNGFVPCATTGEGPTLKPFERNLILEATKKIAVTAGLTTIAGCSSNDTGEVISLIQEAKDLGADAVLVTTPYYNRPTRKGIIAHFEKIADLGQLPVILYHVPHRTAVNLSTDTMTHLLSHPNIIGVKEASGSYSTWLSLSVGCDLSKKSLLCGDDDCFAPLLALGGCGIISASGNVAASRLVSVFREAKNENWSMVFEMQKKLYTLTKALFLETNPGPIKYALNKLGICDNSLRLPLVPVDLATQEEVDAAIRELEII